MARRHQAVQFGDGLPSTGDAVESYEVLLLVEHATNRRLLAEWLREESDHEPVLPDDPGGAPPREATPGSDLCIVDFEALQTHREWLECERDRRDPTFYPVLLLHDEQRDHVGDGVWSVIDEAITTPLDTDVFERRLTNLLERRALSLEQTREREQVEEEYRAVFEASNDGLLVVDPLADEVVEANPAAGKVLGYSPESLASLSPVEDIHPHDVDRYASFMSEVLSAGEAWTDELQCARADGTLVPVEVSASTLPDDRDDVDGVGVVVSIRDVSERREQAGQLARQRDELEKLNRINRTLLETTDAVARAGSRDELEAAVCEQLTGDDRYHMAWIGRFDGDGNEETLTVSRRAGEGQSYLDEISIMDLAGGPLQATLEGENVSVAQDLQSGHAEQPWRETAVEWGFRSCAAVPLVYDGEFAGVLAVYSNRAKQFGEAERAMLADLGDTIGHAIDAIRARDEAHRFEQAVEHAGHSIYLTDDDGVIQYANPAFSEVTGYDPEEAIGESVSILESEEHDGALYQEIEETVAAGDAWQDEVVIRRKDGRLRHVDQTVGGIFGDDGDVGRYVAVNTDITGQRRRQQQLQVLQRVLRHNLRNDLNAVRGFAEVLADDDPDERERMAERRLSEAVDSLLTLGNQARRIDSVFAGSEDDDPTEHRPIGPFLETRCSALRERYPEATVETSVPDVTAAVATELGTAVDELLRNAIDHAEPEAPRVTLDLTVEEDHDGMTWATISVGDEGPGIPDVERAVLQRGEETALMHGSGMGLWLVHWIVTELGGEVAIEDRDGGGSTVTIDLPLGDTDHAR